MKLTEEEQDAIEEAIFTCECASLHEDADAGDKRRETNTVEVLRKLLERLR